MTLYTAATDPDGDVLKYEYSTTGGTIRGKGRSVDWDLTGEKFGTYDANVKVTDGYGGTTTRALKVEIVVYGGCDASPPPCPVISVTCESRSDNIKHIIFFANIKEGRADGWATIIPLEC